MPNPDKNESEKDFVNRCIPMVIAEGTTKDNDQAAAICYSKYQEHKSRKRFKKTYQE